jgi:hypothetical protein
MVTWLANNYQYLMHPSTSLGEALVYCLSLICGKKKGSAYGELGLYGGPLKRHMLHHFSVQAVLEVYNRLGPDFPLPQPTPFNNVKKYFDLVDQVKKWNASYTGMGRKDGGKMGGDKPMMLHGNYESIFPILLEVILLMLIRSEAKLWNHFTKTTNKRTFKPEDFDASMVPYDDDTFFHLGTLCQTNRGRNNMAVWASGTKNVFPSSEVKLGERLWYVLDPKIETKELPKYPMSEDYFKKHFDKVPLFMGDECSPSVAAFDNNLRQHRSTGPHISQTVKGLCQ